MLVCSLGREVNETLESNNLSRSTPHTQEAASIVPLLWKSRALTSPSTSVLSLWEVKEELGSEPLYTQRATINRFFFLSIKAKFHKDASVGWLKEYERLEATWGEKSHTENVINIKDRR